MLDITAPTLVEVQVRRDGRVLWVNVDGACKLRICQIGELVLVDERVEDSSATNKEKVTP
jgi:hypothetical protein